MNTAWIKPNLPGVLLYLNTLFVGWIFMPSSTTVFSLADGTMTVTRPWLAQGLVSVVLLLLYPPCIRWGASSPRCGVGCRLTGPLTLVPLGLAVAVWVGFYLYEPPEIHGQLERHLFLQGSTDWGCGCLFAGTVALYVVFGFTSAWHLVLALASADQPAGFGRVIRRSLWLLRYHLAAFLLGGLANIGADARVTPNDFRNLFLFAAMIYLFSIVWIAGMTVARWPVFVRLTLAPLFTVAWLVAGSDGNTARAGQLVQSGQDPAPIVRGYRHVVMLSWHRLCDSALGDIAEKSTGHP